MTPRLPRVMVVKNPRHVALVSHPLRLEIIERLKADGPDSIAGLARRLERRANALTYHVRLLESAGILVRAGVRKVGRREEAIYVLGADRIALGVEPGSRTVMRAVTRSAAAVVRAAEREIRHAIESGLGRADQLAGRPLGRRQRAWLTEADVAEVHRRLDTLERFLQSRHRKRQGRLYALTIVLAPTTPERKS